MNNDLKYHFASDNTAGVAPEAWQAMEAANNGYAPGYGDDMWTARAADLIRELFETDCEVFFTFNGTAANSLALASLCQSYHSIICHTMAPKKSEAQKMCSLNKLHVQLNLVARDVTVFFERDVIICHTTAAKKVKLKTCAP